MTDHENLLVLAGWLVGNHWGQWGDIDGIERQDVFIRFGLAEEVIATEEDVEENRKFKVGDKLCKLTELGIAALTAWQEEGGGR